MKKFLFVLLVLIILGGLGFFFGWAQLKIPPGSYGVMRSKTHGPEKFVLREGEFHWFWYKLIPTNVEITVYTLEPVRYHIQSSGNLSSGQAYAALAGLDADFSWDISGDLQFSLKPDILPEFTVRENIHDDAGLRASEQNLAAKIGNFALQRLKNYAEDDNGKRMESLALTGSLPELDNDILKAFPEIENLGCTLRVSRYPDYALYQSVKALYSDYLDHQNAILRADTALEAEKRITTRMRMDELARYGELLSKYPILLEYLALEKELLPVHDR